MNREERIKIWDEIGSLSARNSCAMRARRNRYVEEIGLTSSQMDIILYLLTHRQEEIYQVDLERAFRLSNPTVTGLLKRLEAKGFIVRETGEKDRRCKKITATSKAEEVREYVCQKKDEANEAIYGNFTDEELKSFLFLIEKVHKNMMQ